MTRSDMGTLSMIRQDTSGWEASGVGGMTAHEVSQASRALLDAAALLVAEHDEMAAGSVLRCFSRAVHRARAAGCPVTRLPSEAEHIARHWLAARRTGA